MREREKKKIIIILTICLPFFFLSTRRLLSNNTETEKKKINRGVEFDVPKFADMKENLIYHDPPNKCLPICFPSLFFAPKANKTLFSDFRIEKQTRRFSLLTGNSFPAVKILFREAKLRELPTYQIRFLGEVGGEGEKNYH